MKPIIALLALLAVGCTDNQKARHFGGTETIDVPPGEKVLMATFKEGNDLWYLTAPMEPSDKPRVVTFKEKSSLGLMNGTIIFKESK